ncbi:MAG TPA: hypothetical protein QF665_00770 [Alphaproteobacteria bacterium]|nr:hypothetical protein [Alphaproteobacteria bacterium]
MARAKGSGSPLAAAVIGVENLEASLGFYRDVIGLDASPVETWAGPGFERLWGLPAGATARATLCQAGGDEVGRVLLVEFDAAAREPVRARGERRFYALFNLNFYTRDIFASHADLVRRGYEFWTEPVANDLAKGAGSPLEVVFEGPDGVIINFVEVRGAPGTPLGDIRAFLEDHGTTPTGYTPVVTSAHCVTSHAKALAFYQQVLGMEVLMDRVMDQDEANYFLGLPKGSATQITFLKGDNLFGKIVLSAPLNYTPPDLTPRAMAPNIGYLAQAFGVADLEGAGSAAAVVGAHAPTARQRLRVVGLGERAVTAVRNPASGALTWLLGV